MIGRIRTYLTRYHRATVLGVPFFRSGSFQLPKTILVNGAEQQVDIPRDHGSKIAFMDILLDDCYGLEGLTDPVAGVLDIGAHAGLFSLAARMRFPDATIHAYEPNPDMLQFLLHQAAFGSFLVFPQAVGAVSGAVKVLPSEDSVHTRIALSTEGQIKCVAFSDAVAALEREPILVKLDCEGAEWEILGRSKGWDRVSYLTMEYHLWAGYSLAELQKRIMALGFAIRDEPTSTADFGVLTAQKADARESSWT